ncbi:MAG: tRNA lysidine(34) synthetase TilS [Pseudomonadota bacterium]
MMNNAIPPDEFHASMQKLCIGGTRPKIAVAVSGGGDSLALTALMREWVAGRGGEILALTVDHRLRTGSSEEAASVQKLLRARGITHDILTWEGDKPLTHVQELARKARYKLLLSECQRRGFPFLAVAHNLEDQIETFWMRLAHGSGLDGLSAMAPVRVTEGVSIIRPVLPFSRERLRATCLQHGMKWVEDPSNANEKYLRVKLRVFETLLEGEGLTPERLSQTVQKLEDARQALQAMTDTAFAECVLLHQEGYATLKTEEWKRSPREIQRRVLARTLMILSPQQYTAGFEAVEQTRSDLHNQMFAGKTLAGCEIFPGRSGDVLLAREAGAVEGRVRVTEGRVWDGRFSVSGFPAGSLDIGALGEQGLSGLKKDMEGTVALPFKVKRVLPALWQGEGLLAVPHLGYYSPSCPAELKTGRVSFCGKVV